MGADGGTTAKRSDILQLHNLTQKKELQEGENKEQILLQSCAISGLPLYNNSPIVGDFKGKLYIKEKILQYLLEVKLDKSKLKVQFQHLKTLKDLKTVTITWKIIKNIPHFQCPITKELDDKTHYSYLRTCGCVMSYKLLKELKKSLSDGSTKTSQCPICNKTFTFDYDLVIINPINQKEFDDINESNYKYLKNVLQLSNNLEPIKRKKKKSSSIIDIVDPTPTPEFIKKRKQDLDDEIDSSKRIKT
ncbi:rtf2 [Candida pseudojiufengensis]|uniref:rtf2 n=1 Tax=Candida pseudojiufengensis TaxID=497109 RepID=UPI0022244C79|nr:rtf2 [Candida pseudojiufengensis]KAI5960384.1 rtf2 [Candida pseudojiufengensis]